MRSARPGKRTIAEIRNISPSGFGLLLDDKELHVSFEEFPWFRSATIGQIFNVEWLPPGHLRWPDLDIDLDIDSIEHPERYPLMSRPFDLSVKEPAQRTARAQRAKRTSKTETRRRRAP